MSEYFGKYRGQVITDVDPEGLGRIKALVPQVLGPNTPCDWAWPCVPPNVDSSVPKVGSKVWIEFEGGDVDHPIWVGTWDTPKGPIGDVTSVFGRTGAVVAKSGDYNANQVGADAAGAAATAQANAIAAAEAYTNTALEALWPVGSIMHTTVNTNPATLLGFGTWSQIAQGRVVIGVGTGTDINSNTLTVTEGAGGDTVGEYSHKLLAGESGQPGFTATSGGESNQHTHTQFGAGSPGVSVNTNSPSATASSFANNTTGSDSTGHTHSVTVSGAAAGSGHNNIQPFFGVYIWQRTA